MSKRRIILPEEELVAMLRRREQRAFTILYDNYSGALYGIILKIVRDEDIAADVMQDSFVKMWRNIDAYNATKGSLFTWMLNVSRNTAIDKIRSQDYQQSQQNQPIESTVSIVEQSEPIETQVDAIGLRKVIDTLRPEYRTLIELIYFQGYTQAEVSEELGIPLGTVKTRVKAALTQLRGLVGCIVLFMLLDSGLGQWIHHFVDESVN
ncbi:MAG: sigma-70 family RNA polymerase sigma factor [Spirosomataceae bacterium]